MLIYNSITTECKCNSQKSLDIGAYIFLFVGDTRQGK